MVQFFDAACLKINGVSLSIYGPMQRPFLPLEFSDQLLDALLGELIRDLSRQHTITADFLVEFSAIFTHGLTAN
jgi:hypothetical protein